MKTEYKNVLRHLCKQASGRALGSSDHRASLLSGGRDFQVSQKWSNFTEKIVPFLWHMKILLSVRSSAGQNIWMRGDLFFVCSCDMRKSHRPLAVGFIRKEHKGAEVEMCVTAIKDCRQVFCMTQLNNWYAEWEANYRLPTSFGQISHVLINFITGQLRLNWIRIHFKVFVWRFS